MILQKLQCFLAERKVVNLIEVSNYLNVDVHVARNLLQPLLKKGCVCKRSATEKCGNVCQKCDTSLTEVYCWVKAE